VTETSGAPEAKLLYEARGAVAVITMNRPHLANAQDDATIYGLDEAFSRAVDDDAIGAILVRGEGKNFCSGHDHGRPGDLPYHPERRRSVWYDYEGRPGAERQYVREQEIYLAMLRRWRELPKPAVAAVQGACVAGGMMLAWCCDIIVASENAFFSDPVLDSGVPGVELFAHAFEMPARIAREFLMLGQRMSAQRAYELGMVNRVVSHGALFSEALEVAAALAARPRFAMALTKQAFNYVEDLKGRRNATEGVFALHHLAHAHNQVVYGTTGMPQAHEHKSKTSRQSNAIGSRGDIPQRER
jgi:enoyl-CoA hydratase